MARIRSGHAATAFLLCAAVLLLAACSGPSPQANPAQQPGPAPAPLTKVKLSAFQSSFINFPIYVADSLGLFKKHGLEVEIIYGTGIQVTNAVVSGATEFGGFALDHLVTVVDKGQDVRLLVLNETATPFTLVVRNQVNLPGAGKPYPEMLKDLKGLKIGISTVGSSSDSTLRFLIKQAGLDPDKDVQIVPIGQPDTQVAALSKGQVDGTIAFEPIQTELVLHQKVAKTVLDLEAGQGPTVLANYAYNGIAAQGKYIDAHPDAVKAMVASIVEAEEFINDPSNFDQVVDIAAKSMAGIDKDSLRQYLSKYKQIFRPVATKDAITNVLQVNLDNQKIKAAIPYEKLVDQRYMPTSFKFGT